MTFYSTAIMAAKSILQIVLGIIEISTTASAGKFYEQMMAFIQSRSFELYYK